MEYIAIEMGDLRTALTIIGTPVKKKCRVVVIIIISTLHVNCSHCFLHVAKKINSYLLTVPSFCYFNYHKLMHVEQISIFNSFCDTNFFLLQTTEGLLKS